MYTQTHMFIAVVTPTPMQSGVDTGKPHLPWGQQAPPDLTPPWPLGPTPAARGGAEEDSRTIQKCPEAEPQPLSHSPRAAQGPLLGQGRCLGRHWAEADMEEMRAEIKKRQNARQWGATEPAMAAGN